MIIWWWYHDRELIINTQDAALMKKYGKVSFYGKMGISRSSYASGFVKNALFYLKYFKK